MVDLRWLAPLPVDDMLREADATGRVLVVDETVPPAASPKACSPPCSHARFHRRLARVASEDSFIPLGDAALQVLLSEDTIEAAVLRRLVSPGSC